MARIPIDYTNHHGGTHVRIRPHILFSKNKFFKINFFGALFRGPRGSRPNFCWIPVIAPRTLGFFPPLHLIFNKRFYSGTPNLQRHPHASPYSDPSPRVTYPKIFSRLSTSILTLAFTQALPTSNATPTPIHPSDPPPRVTHPRNFCRLSTSIYAIF